MTVTSHPPHRSQQALLTHWAPTSGCDVQANPTCYLSYPFQRIWQIRHFRSFPGSVSGTCFAGTNSPRSGPFPPPPPPTGISPVFVRPLLRYLWACPTSHPRTSQPCSLGIHCADPGTITAGSKVGSPGSRAKSFRACTGSLTTRGLSVSCDNETDHMAFRLIRHRRHPECRYLSRLNTWPTLSPVNASTATSRSPPHDSGPLWLARPSACGTFIHCCLPVLTGAPEL